MSEKEVEVIWKYIKTITGNLSVKHAFNEKTERMALCGREPVWYNDKWHEDVEGVKKRRVCTPCLKKIENKK